MPVSRHAGSASWPAALLFAAALMTPLLIAGGCSEQAYDASTPDAALDSMQQMVADGNARQLVDLLHIEPRDIAFADGVTEESAIRDVKLKAGELLARLQRVSVKLNERFPGEVVEESEFAQSEMGFLFGGAYEEEVSRLLRSPFTFFNEQRERLSTIDLGDGTAAVLVDGEPAFGGVGLQMRDVGGVWKVDLPIDSPFISRYRPETREEWSVIASLMLGLENSLKDFERALDHGEFRSLADASGRAGRMLGESAFVQAIIYSQMKRRARKS